jgi:hypothetical protein
LEARTGSAGKKYPISGRATFKHPGCRFFIEFLSPPLAWEYSSRDYAGRQVRLNEKSISAILGGHVDMLVQALPKGDYET